MRNETRNKIITSGGVLAVGIAGHIANKVFGLEGEVSRYVTMPSTALSAIGGGFTIYYGAKAGLESWLDRYRDSTPIVPPVGGAGHP
ncbi:hypothetical protein J4455_02625 [Candidatus Woesearchaeota archaeon]|nr:hypothetical protein [Candidatus Woesearchaeota archaeon]